MPPCGVDKIAAADDSANSTHTADGDAGSTDSKNPHIHLETTIIPTVMLMTMLPPPMIMPPLTLS